MTMTTTEARAGLDAAQAAEAVEKKKTLQAQLLSIRREKRAVEGELRQVLSEFNVAFARHEDAQGKVLSEMNEITAHMADRPTFADVLPADDPEVREWNEEYSRLQARLQRAITSRDANAPSPDPLRFQAVKLEAQLQQLIHAEGNIAAALRGRRPGAVEGGVFSIG